MAFRVLANASTWKELYDSIDFLGFADVPKSARLTRISVFVLEFVWTPRMHMISSIFLKQNSPTRWNLLKFFVKDPRPSRNNPVVIQKWSENSLEIIHRIGRSSCRSPRFPQNRNGNNCNRTKWNRAMNLKNHPPRHTDYWKTAY